jgi:creatinine deaminase
MMKDRQMDKFMRLAIEEARKSLITGGIPIGSVLVRDSIVLGSGHNRRVQDDDPIMHAEIACLQSAGRLSNYRGCTLYSTLMPCYLCAGAIIQFGIRRVVAGESKTFLGAKGLMESMGIEITDMNLPECIEMMKNFIISNPHLWDEDIGKY